MWSKQLPQHVARGSPKKNSIFRDISTAKGLNRKRVEVGGFGNVEEGVDGIMSENSKGPDSMKDCIDSRKQIGPIARARKQEKRKEKLDAGVRMQ
jgi:hypothetical protein